MLKKKKIYPAYVSKYNSNHEKQVVILTISNKEKWHYLAVKILLLLLRGISSKHHGDLYYLNCLHSFTTEKKRESHKKVFESKYFCNIIMPSEDTKILEFNQYQKSDKATFIIHADLECIIDKIDGCKNNPENSYTAKVTEHIPSCFAMSTILSFRNIENKHNLYRGKAALQINIIPLPAP